MTLRCALKLSMAYKFVFKYYLHKKINQTCVGINNYEFGDVITGYLSNDNEASKIALIVLE